MSLAAGSLNRLITIQARSGGLDELGQSVATWDTYASVWSDPRGQTGMSAIKSAAEGVTTPVNRYSFRIRHRRDISTGMRLTDGVDVYDIVDVRHDLKDREWTDLVCEVGGNDG